VAAFPVVERLDVVEQIGTRLGTRGIAGSMHPFVLRKRGQIYFSFDPPNPLFLNKSVSFSFGIFAPNSKQRAQVTPAKRGKGKKTKTPDARQDKTPAERRASMTWSQRLKRVFNIDIETCSQWGGAVKVITCIEDPAVIEKILTRLKKNRLSETSPRCARAGHPLKRPV
jgi:hypothetical protein